MIGEQQPQDHQDAIIEVALDKPELSPREVAVTYTDSRDYFVSESSVYRLLKAQDLITSPANILMQASDKFQHPSKRVNELWQTDFTYFKLRKRQEVLNRRERVKRDTLSMRRKAHMDSKNNLPNLMG